VETAAPEIHETQPAIALTTREQIPNNLARLIMTIRESRPGVLGSKVQNENANEGNLV